MRAFTVYQPYAYAIVAGWKLYETRSKRTNIRGRVAVHAGKASLSRATQALSDRAFGELLGAVGGKTDLPLGAVVGTVEIVDCLPVEAVIPTLTERERVLGDYSPGRWAWVLKNSVMFHTPVPARGKQGWWNWEECGEMGWECTITGGACMFLLPDSRLCAAVCGEGPDDEKVKQGQGDGQ